MLQSTVRRIEPLVPAERVWVITNRRYVELVQEQLPDIPKQNIIGEPVAKNTAPCVAAATALIQQQDEEATMAVLPADHLITDTDGFLSVLQAAADKAESSKALVTIGIKPTRPETGYGYIEFDKESTESVDGHEAKKVKQFREKPNITTARQFIYASRFLWNSGMFIWTAPAITGQFKKHQPDIYEAMSTLSDRLGESNGEAINTFYQSCPSISIDYGIMENADDVYVIPGDFGWNDVGSWKALYDLGEKDETGTVSRADKYITEESSNNLIHSENGKIIALVGVENLAVVETDEAILVCNLDKAQSVKQVVNKLDKKEGTKDYV